MPRFDGILGAFPQYLMMLRSQYWPDPRREEYVNHHLKMTLSAARRILFYRERFPTTNHLADLPILARRDVPALAASVRGLYPEGSLLASGLTSGSTGTPVSFIYDRTHQASRFAARARYLRENGWNPLQRNFWIVSTAMETPDLVFVQRRRLLGMRFMSHLTDMEVLADALKRIDPVFLYSYPVNLDGLARIFEARADRPHSLRRIFSGSEVLEPTQRERIRRVFGVDISDNYGTTEAFLAWECPAGSYHINAEHVIVEVVDDAGAPASPGSLGRVVLTTLRNRVMPLIRYEIGDYAVAAAGRCRCGRTLPLIGAIAGRDINLFFTKSGKHFSPWPLFRPMYARTWITQTQIVQRDLDRFLVRYVSPRALSSDDEAEVHHHFETMLGTPAAISFERADKIARSRSGKFMMALNEMDSSA